MARIAVQIGHVNGQSGAGHEEETLLMVVPHIEARLRAAGHKVTHYDGRLQSEPGNFQHDHDGALFVHCDDGGNRSTFSVGYWDEMHPGSNHLAMILRDTYAAETGIRFDAFNITVGEAHYYGNRRFTHLCKCTLIELGFVSNPTQRTWLQNNAQRVGYACANAYIKYFGEPVEEEEMALAITDSGPVPVKEWVTTGKIGIRNGKAEMHVDNRGSGVLHLTVQIQVKSSGDFGNVTRKIDPSSPKRSSLDVFDIGGTFRNPNAGELEIILTGDQPFYAERWQEIT